MNTLTQPAIIEFAKQAGAEPKEFGVYGNPGFSFYNHEILEKFAHLCRAELVSENAEQARTDLGRMVQHGKIVKIIGVGKDYRPDEHDRGEWLDEDGICIEFEDGYRDCFYLSELYTATPAPETLASTHDALRSQRDMWESLFIETRADRDALRLVIEGCLADQKENLSNQCELQAEINALREENKKLKLRVENVDFLYHINTKERNALSEEVEQLKAELKEKK